MPTTVTFVAAGSLAVNATLASQAIVAPACAANDILIAAVFNKSIAANAISAPDGTWTEVVAQAVNDCTTAADEFRFSLWWKRATGSGGSFTFTKATDDNVLFGGVIVAYRGAKTSGNPIHVRTIPYTSTTAPADSVTFPNYSPSYHLIRMVFVAFYGNDQTTFAAAMSDDVNPDCTIDTDQETSTGTDFTIAICSGISDGTPISQRGWASNATVDAGNTGVVFSLLAQNDPPTVVLNSPADADTTQGVTPTFDFTGTDADADPIEYNIQIATDPMFGVIDSYSESNRSVDMSIGQTTGDHGLGQSFTGNGGIATAALFYMKNMAGSGATGNATAKIYAHSGTFGTSSVPTGSALATSDNLDVTTIPEGLSLVTFTFSGANQIVLVNTTKYVVTVEYNSGGGSTIQVGGDNTSSSHSGNLIFQNSSDVWAAFSTWDLCFYVRSAILDKFSATDAGFVNPDTGGDTHPFNSGENIQYTVQSGEELSLQRTYYWRVSGIDPAGHNSYGAWSATRTFGPL